MAKFLYSLTFCKQSINILYSLEQSVVDKTWVNESLFNTRQKLETDEEEQASKSATCNKNKKRSYVIYIHKCETEENLHKWRFQESTSEYRSLRTSLVCCYILKHTKVYL